MAVTTEQVRSRVNLVREQANFYADAVEVAYVPRWMPSGAPTNLRQFFITIAERMTGKAADLVRTLPQEANREVISALVSMRETVTAIVSSGLNGSRVPNQEALRFWQDALAWLRDKVHVWSEGNVTSPSDIRSPLDIRKENEDSPGGLLLTVGTVAAIGAALTIGTLAVREAMT